MYHGKIMIENIVLFTRGGETALVSQILTFACVFFLIFLKKIFNECHLGILSAKLLLFI
jgi:energy-converting hydrogenase Eha subunit F